MNLDRPELAVTHGMNLRVYENAFRFVGAGQAMNAQPPSPSWAVPVLSHEVKRRGYVLLGRHAHWQDHPRGCSVFPMTAACSKQMRADEAAVRVSKKSVFSSGIRFAANDPIGISGVDRDIPADTF